MKHSWAGCLSPPFLNLCVRPHAWGRCPRQVPGLRSTVPHLGRQLERALAPAQGDFLEPLGRQVDANRLKHGLAGTKVQSLRVHQHTVVVPKDGEHGPLLFLPLFR